MVHRSTSLDATWDDLRYALFLARDGSVRGAARTLGVSHSTVLRRVSELEARLGVRLFERSDGSYRPTEAGRDVFETARELEERIASLARRVEGRDLRLAGPVRVTLPDPLVRPLLEVFSEIRRAQPEVELTLVTGERFVDLAHREADIALRIALEPPAELIGRRVAMVASAAYASTKYLKGRRARDLASLDWIRFESGSGMSFERWIEEHVPNARTAMRVSSGWAMEDAVAMGLGVTILPCVTGDARPEWSRVHGPAEFPAGPLWVLTHRDLRATARVRAVRDMLVEALVRRRERLEGRAPAARPRR